MTPTHSPPAATEMACTTRGETWNRLHPIISLLHAEHTKDHDPAMLLWTRTLKHPPERRASTHMHRRTSVAASGSPALCPRCSSRNMKGKKCENNGQLPGEATRK